MPGSERNLERNLVAVTLGDPAGIGPEVVLGALKDEAVHTACVPVVFGTADLLERCAQTLGLAARPIVRIQRPAEAQAGVINVIDTPSVGVEGIAPGIVSRAAGRAAMAGVRGACDAALANEIDAIATAPINKESLKAAGSAHIGHTEMLADWLRADDPLTVFLTGPMRIFFLSRHLSLRAAIDYITRDRVLAHLRSVHGALEALDISRPKIALAALNPHAGDGGQFGDEEILHLIPAVEVARAEGLDVSGPVPADSVFHMALEGRFDAVCSLYHDQGHVAAKTRDFHGTITATLNLPVLRTSVDHGTALDIAWQGLADPVSMKAAILAAAHRLR